MIGQRRFSQAISEGDGISLIAPAADADAASAAERAGAEGVVEVRDADELELALERLDPEIFLLAPREAGDADDPLESVLDLLPDIPAGKLAIADLEVTTPDEIAELERAGVDAVIVASHNLAGLVRAAPPEV